MEREYGVFKLGPEKSFKTVIYSKSEAILMVDGQVGKKNEEDTDLTFLFSTGYMFLKK